MLWPPCSSSPAISDLKGRRRARAVVAKGFFKDSARPTYVMPSQFENEWRTQLGAANALSVFKPQCPNLLAVMYP
jgi:hypothetical protein